MSQSLPASNLPTSLRALRVGLDDNVHIRRTVHLAAAKIEDLQQQVMQLVTALEAAEQEGGGGCGAAGRVPGPAYPHGIGDARH